VRFVINENKGKTMDLTYLSREGYEQLRDKLDYLTKVKRKEIAKSLEYARGFGDLSENAEYEAAKSEQDLNEAKISELTEQVSRARIMDDLNIPKDQAFLGARVKIKDLKTNEEFDYTLVSPLEADFDQNKLSVTSPIGKGLLSHREKDIVEIAVPAGKIRYQILKISRP
jgi:transcription elongation factor GreA